MAFVYGDLHIHLGRTSQDRPVKITASPQLTLENIWRVAKNQKGLQLVGLIDAACSGVLTDLKDLLNEGALKPLERGGYDWHGLVLFLGSEVEIAHETGREAHFLAFFPCLESLESYARSLATLVTNPSLSTQRLKTSGDHWLKIVEEQRGVALAAHAFTPHKGVYGNCVETMAEMFADPRAIHALELGLSANTKMALQIRDTHSYAYLANSDAHSLANIGREFTLYNLPTLDFTAWQNALNANGAGIVANHGLEPLLGKYYRSFCPRCQLLAKNEPMLQCPNCGQAVILGVWDRIQLIRNSQAATSKRPPYRTHVPLQMLPGIGPKTYLRMIRELGTEIDILYSLDLERISDVVGPAITKQIASARQGELPIQPGGGGIYGKVTKA